MDPRGCDMVIVRAAVVKDISTTLGHFKLNLLIFLAKSLGFAWPIQGCNVANSGTF